MHKKKKSLPHTVIPDLETPPGRLSASCRIRLKCVGPVVSIILPALGRNHHTWSILLGGTSSSSCSTSFCRSGWTCCRERRYMCSRKIIFINTGCGIKTAAPTAKGVPALKLNRTRPNTFKVHNKTMLFLIHLPFTSRLAPLHAAAIKQVQPVHGGKETVRKSCSHLKMSVDGWEMRIKLIEGVNLMHSLFRVPFHFCS